MSLAETQQIMQILQEIMALLNGVMAKTSSINRDLPQTKTAIASKRDLLRLLNELNIAFALMGATDINDYTRKLQQAIFFTNMLVIAVKIFERGTLIGNILGAATVAGAMGSALTIEGY